MNEILRLPLPLLKEILLRLDDIFFHLLKNP
jgi:hypothetical protein